MSRLWTEGEKIRVELDAHNWPASFTWQGQAHPVIGIRQRWQVDSDWWSESGRVWREYMAVTTRDGLLCVVYFNLIDRQWYLARIYD
jgi:hypothetical protein